MRRRQTGVRHCVMFALAAALLWCAFALICAALAYLRPEVPGGQTWSREQS